MSEIINIGGLSAAPGQRVHGFISIGNGEFSLPATIVRGEKPGKTALITAGIPVSYTHLKEKVITGGKAVFKMGPFSARYYLVK